jgi:hypothetical protein
VELTSSSYRPTGETVCRDIAGEAVLVKVARSVADAETVFCTSEVGRFIFERVSSGSSLAEVRDAIVAEFEVGAERAERDLLTFVARLCEAGLIEEVSGDALPRATA